MFGTSALYVALALSLITMITYFGSRGINRNMLNFARAAFLGASATIIMVSVFLLVNILNHNYSYTYIYSNSSSELPRYLLIASFYAGQEGSYLFWGLMSAIIGVILLVSYIRKKEEPGENREFMILGFYSLVLVFLMLLTISKNPFARVWETYADAKIPKDYMPVDGRGMNPVLENFWMAIHPPVLFLGYAAMVVPFLLVLGGFLRNNWQDWVRRALPWAHFSAAVLGLGIVLGGFWAYETLGWGGFWGWDPVENSSLLPWMVIVALIHTLKIQKRTGGFVKTNFLLSMLSFLLVLYAVFLTRSGILSKTSVHSFEGGQGANYYLLLAFMAVMFLTGITVFLIKLRKIKIEHQPISISSREFAVLAGTILLLVSSLIIFIGTSLPVMSELLGTTAEKVETSFYNDWNIPLVALMMIINSVAIYLSWKKTAWPDFFRRGAVAFALGIVATIILIIAGVTRFDSILIAFAAFISLFVSSDLAIRALKNKPLKAGAHISHIGLSILALGVIGSCIYSDSKVMTLVEGERQTAFGKSFVYNGSEQIEKDNKSKEKTQFNIGIGDENSREISSNIGLVSYLSAFNNWSEFFSEPAIKSFYNKDIYLSIKSYNNKPDMPSVELQKGQAAICPADSTMYVRFVGFDMTHAMTNSPEENVKFGAIVEFSRDTARPAATRDTLVAMIDPQTMVCDPVWEPVAGTNLSAGFSSFSPNGEDASQSVASISFMDNAAAKNHKESVIIEVSQKPYISLVWIGFIAIMLGFAISMFKYTRKESK